MSRRVKELEKRVSWLEAELNKLRATYWENNDDMNNRITRYRKEIYDIVESYVNSHIWMTTAENPKDLEKGNQIRILIRDAKKVLGED